MSNTQRSASTRIVTNRSALSSLAVLTMLLFGCDGDSDFRNVELTDFTVQGSTSAFYPAFDSQTLHYAVVCGANDVLTLSATAANKNASISIDGSEPVKGSAEVELTNLASDQDIIIEVTRGSSTGKYTLHCLAEDFPEIQVVRKDPGVNEGLLLVAPRFRENGEQRSWILILDNNGVPRYREKILNRVTDFKRHPNGQFSYALALGDNAFGLPDSEILILDENLNELQRLQTVGLNHTDDHDFIITDEGTSIFISYNSTVRDMTAFGLAADEVVGDSVIQEISGDGEVIFEWNSWDHMDVSDCQNSGFPRFPSDYAHLNGLDLTPDGDLIGSFRGCGQVLKIDRPTGDVIWYLGGSRSDFEIVGDSFNEFCGQHTALEPAPDTVLMFDNGNHCLGDRDIVFGEFSRAVEYRLDTSTGQATFVRDHSLNGTYQEFTRSTGSVQQLEDGSWLIGWGRGPDMSVTEVNAEGEEVFAMKILIDDAVAVSYRAFREADLMME